MRCLQCLGECVDIVNVLGVLSRSNQAVALREALINEEAQRAIHILMNLDLSQNPDYIK